MVYRMIYTDSLLLSTLSSDSSSVSFCFITARSIYITSFALYLFCFALNRCYYICFVPTILQLPLPLHTQKEQEKEKVGDSASSVIGGIEIFEPYRRLFQERRNIHIGGLKSLNDQSFLNGVNVCNKLRCHPAY